MGASVKTINRIAQFVQDGLLPRGGTVADIGTQNLRCATAEVTSFANALDVSISQRTADDLSAGGLLGDLLRLVGFQYTAFDIFEEKNTVVLDLNRQFAPADALSRFDLVANYGTTEHVLNQMLAMRTIHDLAKPGGVIHHDLPMAGYLSHCYFRYNLGLFHDLAGANAYDVILQTISAGPTRPTPSAIMLMGYPEGVFRDYGVEIAFRKTVERPFCIPVDNSSSTTISDAAWRGDDAVTIAPTLPADIRFLFSRLPFRSVHNAYWSRVFDTMKGRIWCR